ncbi:hypothetical protein TH63_08245 [Rufibacter radiotolerans]|uniref:Uncharacterized protein n=1 Tax=Rufibacter radiotolerans TaxID=1379910 RepID=A0A0H4VPK4_9BACT|nr:hypothetical protein TH63_08245 [Rufibacter radiotolerans]
MALLRAEGKEAARAVRGGKTGPRGRERSEGNHETLQHKDSGKGGQSKVKAECAHPSESKCFILKPSIKANRAKAKTPIHPFLPPFHHIYFNPRRHYGIIAP